MRRISPYLLSCVSCVLLLAEPSAFESQSGATKKDIRNLKDSSLNLSSIIVDIQGRLETLEQVQYGLQSLYDSQNQKLQNILGDLEKHSLTSQETRAQVDLLKENYDRLSQDQKKLEVEQKKFLEMIEGIEKKIRELTEIGANLNALVLKEFENVKTELKKQAEVILTNQDNVQKLSLELEKFALDQKKEREKSAFKFYEKKSDVLKEAKRMFWDKKFNEARDRFSWLVSQNYQKAESNYFLGQIAYRQKRYEDAIFYYRESATIDDKASYMPLLMLNTAKSFEAIKDLKNTLKFAETLLSLYPKSKEAIEAKKIQNKLKGEKKDGK
ncbi:tetratricopeptide repeat protein [Helicobacter pametensis]|uniref:tetratricopeptide repeat protein n=1 Tax=Helicobacter pametensis TaxID=95149 RepID=UPI0012EBC8AB|nr:tetratricopeptide repeat protein [Helicobacter pametensis]